MNTVQREGWSGQPARLGESWRLHKSRCQPAKEAVCRLQSHVFRWELILEINSSLYDSQVCRNSEQILTTAEQWKKRSLKRVGVMDSRAGPDHHSDVESAMNRWRTSIVLVAMTLASAATILVAQPTAAKLEGSGDSVSDVVSLQKGLLMVGAAHKGERDFVVQLISTDGEKTELLINTFGNYQGVRLIPIDAGRYRFQVRADQAWVLLHEQPDPKKPGTPLPITHRLSGDAPLGPFDLKRGLFRAAFTHEGARNFNVTLYRSDGEMVGLLVNKIGAYNGWVTEVIRKPGLYWLAVRASGAWSCKLEMDQMSQD